MTYLVPKNELKNKTLGINTLVNSMTTPYEELNNPDLVNVHIVTLMTHAEDVAAEDVLAGRDMDQYLLEELEYDILTCLTQYHREQKEFVDIGDDCIIVGINAEKIDDSSIDHALSLICQVEDPTEHKRTEFGEYITLPPR